MRTRATVAGLTSSAAPMAASVQPGPASPWLAFNRIRAWVRALGGRRLARSCCGAGRARPRIGPRRVACAPLPPAAAGFPGPHEHEAEPHMPQVTTDELLALRHPHPITGQLSDLRSP